MASARTENEDVANGWRDQAGWVVGCLLLSILLPLVALSEFRSEYYEAGYTAVSPFVFARVVVFQLVLTLPAVLFFAWHLSSIVRPSPWLLCGAGIFLMLLGFVFSDPISLQASAAPIDQRWLYRLGWCAILLFPWAWAAVLFLRLGQQQGGSFRSIWWVDALIVLSLLALPVIFARQEIERQQTLIQEAFGNQQYREALERSYHIYALGTDSIIGQPSADVINGLSAEVTRLRRQVETALPADATEEQKVARAVERMSLGDLDEAAGLLKGVATPRAKYHGGRLAELRRDWTDAAEKFGRVVEDFSQLSAGGAIDDEQLPLLRAGIERRVNNLRRAGRFGEAEAELKQALVDWPVAKDRILMQLALHYKLAGRGADAVSFFEQAATENPQFADLAAQEISLLRGQAQGCLIRINRGASR